MAADPIPMAAPTTAVFLVIVGNGRPFFVAASGFGSTGSSNAFSPGLVEYIYSQHAEKQGDPEQIIAVP